MVVPMHFPPRDGFPLMSNQGGGYTNPPSTISGSTSAFWPSLMRSQDSGVAFPEGRHWGAF